MNPNDGCFRTLGGSCADGAERDRGRLAHWVKGGSFGLASCGVRPGRTSVGWTENQIDNRTCPRCLDRLVARVTRAMKEQSHDERT